MLHLLVGVPGGPADMVPSADQSPVMKSSFLSSGAGVGGAICAQSMVAVRRKSTTDTSAKGMRLIWEVSSKVISSGGQILGAGARFVNEGNHILQMHRRAGFQRIRSVCMARASWSRGTGFC